MVLHLREAREVRGWSSDKLQALMREAADRRGLIINATRSSMRVMISRWENGRAQPDPLHCLLLEEVYGLSASALGLPEPSDVERQAVSSLPRSSVADGNPALLEYFEHQLVEHVRLDNITGPRYVIDTVVSQLHQVEQLAERGSPEMTRLAARFAEFAGWLLQDLGDHPAEALRATERSIDLAQAVSDAELATYNRMRKSNVLSSMGDRRLAATTAELALRAAQEEFRELVPVCLRQHALASAQRGDEHAARGAIDRALALTHPAVGSAPGMSPYCTTSYVQMEAALCLLTLRHPAAAEQACAEALLRWPAELVRDRSLCLVRRAVALAELRKVDEACSAALLALESVRSAPSGRAVHMLRLVGSRLRPFNRSTTVRELLQALAGVA